MWLFFFFNARRHNSWSSPHATLLPLLTPHPDLPAGQRQAGAGWGVQGCFKYMSTSCVLQGPDAMPQLLSLLTSWLTPGENSTVWPC